MGVNFSRSSHLWFFGGLIPLTSWYLSYLLFNYFASWPNWLEGPSPLFLYGIIYYVFDKYFWQFKIFKTLGIVWFPNFNGRWKGKQRSSYRVGGQNVETEGKLEVRQSFSKISIKSYYQISESDSVTANFAEINDEVYLFYTYDNDPSSLRAGTMAKHKGTAKIKHLPNEKKLTGCYWNSMGNYGELNYKFEQKKLLGRY